MKSFSLMMVMLLTVLVGCKQTNLVDDFVNRFNNGLFADRNNYDIKVIKDETLQGGGWVVFEVRRTRYCICPGGREYTYHYRAINVESWEEGMTSSEAESLYYGGLVVTDQGNGTYTNGDLTFETAFSFEKDLERVGARIEQTEMDRFAVALRNNYGFSVDRSEVVARTTYSFNKIRKRRSLTSEDLDHFFDVVAGTDYRSFQKVMRESNRPVETDLVKKAAEINGTSPEAISALIIDLF